MSKEIIKKYISCYVEGSGETKPSAEDSGNDYAVKVVNRTIVQTSSASSEGELVISEVSMLGTSFMGVLDSAPTSAKNNDWYWDTVTNRFRILKVDTFVDADNGRNIITGDVIAFQSHADASWPNVESIRALIEANTNPDLRTSLDAGDNLIFYNEATSSVYQITAYNQNSGALGNRILAASGHYKGELSTDPHAIANGDWYYDTDDNIFKYFNGSSFIRALSLGNIDSNTVPLNNGLVNSWDDDAAVLTFLNGAPLVVSFINTAGNRYVYFNTDRDDAYEITNTGTTASPGTATEAAYPASGAWKGSLAAAPASPANGDIYFHSDPGNFRSYRYRLNDGWNTTRSTVDGFDIVEAEGTGHYVIFQDGDDLDLDFTSTADVVAAIEGSSHTLDLVNNIYVYHTASGPTRLSTYTAGSDTLTMTQSALDDSTIDSYYGTRDDDPPNVENDDWHWDSTNNRFRVRVGGSWQTAGSTSVLDPNHIIAFESTNDPVWVNTGAVLTALNDGSLSTDIFSQSRTYVYYDQIRGSVIEAHSYTAPTFTITSSAVALSNTFKGALDSEPLIVATNDDWYWDTTTNRFRVLKNGVFVDATLGDGVNPIQLRGGIGYNPLFESGTDASLSNVEAARNIIETSDYYRNILTNGDNLIFYNEDTNSVYEVTSFSHPEGGLSGGALTVSGHYKGELSADPDTLSNGDWYYNVPDGLFKVFDGTSFVTADATNRIDANTLPAVAPSVPGSGVIHVWNTAAQISTALEDGTLSTTPLAGAGRYVYYDSGRAAVYEITDTTSTTTAGAFTGPAYTATGIYKGILTTDPSTATANDFYYVSGSDGSGTNFRFYNGTSWLFVGGTTQGPEAVRIGTTNHYILFENSQSGDAFVEDNTQSFLDTIAESHTYDTTNNVYLWYDDSTRGSVARLTSYTAPSSTFTVTDNSLGNVRDGAYYGTDSDDPPNTEQDDWYWNTDDDRFRVFFNSSWRTAGAGTVLRATPDYTPAFESADDAVWANLNEIRDALDAGTLVYPLTGGQRYVYYDTSHSEVRFATDYSRPPLTITSSAITVSTFKGISAEALATLADGVFYYDTTDDEFKIYESGSYVQMTETDVAIGDFQILYTSGSLIKTQLTAGTSKFLGVHASDAEANTAAAGASAVNDDWYYNNGSTDRGVREFSGSSWGSISSGDFGSSPDYELSQGDSSYASDQALIDDYVNPADLNNPNTTAYVYYNTTDMQVYAVTGYTPGMDTNFADTQTLEDSLGQTEINGTNTYILFKEDDMLVYQIDSYTLARIGGVAGSETIDESAPGVAKTSSASDVVFGKLISVSADGRTCRVVLVGSNVIFAGNGNGGNLQPHLIGRGIRATSTVGMVEVSGATRGPRDRGRVVSGTTEKIRVNIPM